MTTPIYPSKRFYRAGFKLTPADTGEWGTGIALVPASGILIENDGNPTLKQPYDPHDDIDAIMALDGDLGPIGAVDFAPDFAERYDPGPLGSMIAALFGTCPVPSASKSTIDWADTVSRFGSFAVERPGTIIEVTSAMPMKYNLKIAAGLLKGSIGLRGNTLITDSALNTAAVMLALTYQDRGNRIKFSEGVLRMNAEIGEALASTDELEISDIDVGYERTLDDVHEAGSESIILPKEKGFKMTVKITLPRTSAANLAYLATFKAMAAQKMDIVFTSPNIVSEAIHYGRTYGFPRLKLTAPPAAPLADIMTTVLTFEAEEAAEAPDGMTGHVRPYIEMVNKQATGYLA